VPVRPVQATASTQTTTISAARGWATRHLASSHAACTLLTFPSLRPPALSTPGGSASTPQHTRQGGRFLTVPDSITALCNSLKGVNPYWYLDNPVLDGWDAHQQVFARLDAYRVAAA